MTKKTMRIIDVLDMDIPTYEKLWMILRKDVIGEKACAEILNKFAAHANTEYVPDPERKENTEWEAASDIRGFAIRAACWDYPDSPKSAINGAALRMEARASEEKWQLSCLKRYVNKSAKVKK